MEERLSIKTDPKVRQKFRQYCEKRGLTMRFVLHKLIAKYMKGEIEL